MSKLTEEDIKRLKDIVKTMNLRGELRPDGRLSFRDDALTKDDVVLGQKVEVRYLGMGHGGWHLAEVIKIGRKNISLKSLEDPAYNNVKLGKYSYDFQTAGKFLTVREPGKTFLTIHSL